MKPLQLAGQFYKANRRADDSVAITIITAEEISTELFTEIDKHRKQNGFFMFKSNSFSEADIPQEDARVTGQISPSKQLYAALFVKHMRTGGNKEDFPAYYQKAMRGFKQAVQDSYEA